MAKDLIESISGIRGIVGPGLTPQRVVDYISAFGHWIEGSRVVVGQDSRPTGPIIRQLVTSTLGAQGIEVCDIGIAPTPTLQWMTERLNASGGIMITASHNPEQWNGLKFISADGLFLNPEQFREMMQIRDQGNYTFQPWNKIGEFRKIHGAIDEHIESVLDLSYIDADAIAEREFTVAVDAVNGAGSIAIPALLEALGCRVIPLYCVPNGQFPHNPEPLPANLTRLCETVRENGADLGIAVDPDADRCGLVDETGTYLVEEYTLAIGVDTVLHHLQQEATELLKRPVVTNLSTTLAIEKIAEKYGTEVLRTPVGEINVAARMAEEDAVVGGEGNGGVILGESHLGRDSLVASALALQRLADLNSTLSEYYASLPQFVMSKQKMDLGDTDPDAMLERIAGEKTDAAVDTQDGVKLTWIDRWVHLRKSNTEPILRVYTEATSRERAESLADEYTRKLQQLME